jgi:uncharacterized repeat protein (TIGR03847 family)
MPDNIELDAVDHITIGTIGPPGERVFHLQAREDETLVTLTIEKFQAEAIANSIETLLEKIGEEYGRETPEERASTLDFALHEPILPVFRVSQIGLGYDEDDDRLYIVVREMLPEEELQEPRTARFGATREQMRALAEHAHEVVAQGRPICGNCGEPIDPDGHFCPKSNGHRKPVAWA